MFVVSIMTFCVLGLLQKDLHINILLMLIKTLQIQLCYYLEVFYFFQRPFTSFIDFKRCK